MNTAATSSGFDDMASDSLDGPEYDAANVRQARVQPGNLVFKEPCRKCNGTGSYGRFTSLGHSQCTQCKGRGFQEYRTSPEHRAKQREKDAEAKARRMERDRLAAIEAAGAWLKERPAVRDWLNEKSAAGNAFAQSLSDSVLKWGRLTEGQERAVLRSLAEEAQKAEQAERAKALDAAADAHVAPVINVDRVREAFAKAMSTGLQRPRLMLDEFVFKPAASTGRNPGAIYVTKQGEYLGKVLGGAFHRVRACDDLTELAVVHAAADPAGAAVRYGRLFGKCSVCNRDLVDPVSVERGIGPICAERYGF